MLELLIGILAVSVIAALLAFLLEVADSYIADYGECHVLVNEQKDMVVQGGEPLLFAMSEGMIFLPSACGGKGTCGYCKIKVIEGGGPVLPTETPYLDTGELEENVRLACQLKVKEDLKVTIPEDLLLAREFKVRVEHIKDLTPDIKEIRFALLEPEDGITFRAGQYVQLQIPRYGKTSGPEFRAYSIASSVDDHHHVELVVTKVPEGAVSTYVHEYLKQGDELIMRGPFGDFCLCRSERDLLMIATGSGIAPIRSMLSQLRKERCAKKVTFFFGDRRPFDLLYYDDLKQLEGEMTFFRYIPTLSRCTEEDDWEGERGRVTDLVKKYISDDSSLDVYICGVPAMVQSCIDLLVTKGIPEEHICHDKFE